MRKLIKWFENKNINYKKWLVIVYVVFIMVPVLLANSVGSDNENVFVKTLASVLLLAFFVMFFIYDFRKKVADDWGVFSISVGKSDYKMLAEDLQSAKTVKAMISYDMEELYNVFSENVPNGKCEYQFLLLNPYSEYGQMDYEPIKNNEQYTEKFEEFASTSGKTVDIKYFSLIPFDNVILVDDKVFVYPISQQLNDGRRICRIYKGKKRAYEHYSIAFQKTWVRPVFYKASNTDQGGNVEQN